jgi:hypothetical protein
VKTRLMLILTVLFGMRQYRLHHELDVLGALIRNKIEPSPNGFIRTEAPWGEIRGSE